MVLDQDAGKACQFLDLPADVRNIIYDFAFFSPEGMHVDFSQDLSGQICTRLAALSRTCKALYHETKDLPVWLNTIHLHIPLLEDPAISQQSGSVSLTLPLPQRDPSTRRHIRLSSERLLLTDKSPSLREQARQFLTLAMRLPHIDETLQRFERFVKKKKNQIFISRMRRVHVHLGSQIRNTFAARFHTAWDRVAPMLFRLHNIMMTTGDLRILFTLRISKRLVVEYDFGLSSLKGTLDEMDACVPIKDEDLTLPELATINDVRGRVWRAFFHAERTDVIPTPFRYQVDKLMEMGRQPAQTARIMRRIAAGQA